MNKEWAEQNEEMQSLIKKAGTFEKGKDVLFGLRNDLMDTLLSYAASCIYTVWKIGSILHNAEE